MYLAYFDESGDPGRKNSPTKYFILSCVLVHEAQWLKNLDQLVKVRQALRKRFGLSSRVELKASHIRKGRGPFKALRWSPADRLLLYGRFMTLQPKRLDLKTFAVAIVVPSAVRVRQSTSS